MNVPVLADQPQAYKIASINLNMISTRIKLQLLRDMLRAADVDVALLQEVQVETLPDFYGFTPYVTPADERGSGTAALVRDGIEVTNVMYLPSARGLAFDMQETRVINVYAPSGTDKRRERSRFYAEEITPLFLGRYNNLIIGGDFNSVLSPKDQQPNYTPCPELRLLVQHLRLADTWEVLHGDRPGFTYVTSHSASRLDRIYVSSDLVTAVLAAERWPTAFSDHSAYICTVHLRRQTVWRSRGLWKLNVALLRDQECRQLIESTWTSCERRLQRYPSTIKWWLDCVKPALRRALISYGRERALWHRHTTDFYYTLLRELTSLPPSPDRQAEIRRIKAKILTLTRHKLEGVVVRTRCQDRIDGERPSMHHIISERRQKRRTLVNTLELSDGSRVSTQAAITRAFIDHYQQLYQDVQHDNVDLLEVTGTITHTLDAAASASLMEEITNDDVTDAIAKGAVNKSPGPDGFPLEFYRTFQDLMAPRWKDMYNEVMSLAVPIPPAFTEGVIIPVPKPSGRTRPEHYRPITLLNSDFKIFTRILAMRLKRVMRQFISNEQTSLGGDNNIQTALSDYRDVIAIATACRLRGALVSVDFDRAFDKVSHSFLGAVMERMAFPAAFIQVIMRILHGATSRLMVNGRVEGHISILRSVRQGCPLSTILYAAATEPLLCGLKQRLLGITLRGSPFQCRAYADDLVFISRSEEEIRTALRWIERYGNAAGSTMNLAKSRAMEIGRGLPEGSEAPLQTTDTLRCLGIIFTKTIRRTSALNYKRLLQVLRAGARGHLLRALDMVQKVAFINTHMASRIPHLAQILPMTPVMAQRIQAAFGYLVSHGHIFKIRYETLTLHPRNGGLGLVNVRARATALFIKTMIKMWTHREHSFTGLLIEELAPPSYLPPVALAHIAAPLSHIQTFFLEYSYVYPNLPNTRTPTARDVYSLLMENYQRNWIERRHPGVAWPAVWRAIDQKYFTTGIRATWYLVVNEKFPTRRRLHDIALADTPICVRCQVIDSDEHRLECGTSAEVWLLIRKMLGFFLRVPPHMIEPGMLLRPTETYFPQSKTHAINWIKGLSIYYLFRDSHKEVLDFWIFLQERHDELQKYSRYRPTFGNYLGSVFNDPPRSWAVPGKRR